MTWHSPYATYSIHINSYHSSCLSRVHTVHFCNHNQFSEGVAVVEVCQFIVEGWLEITPLSRMEKFDKKRSALWKCENILKLLLGVNFQHFEYIRVSLFCIAGYFLFNFMLGLSWSCWSSLKGNCPRIVHHHHFLLRCLFCPGHLYWDCQA